MSPASGNTKKEVHIESSKQVSIQLMSPASGNMNNNNNNMNNNNVSIQLMSPASGNRTLLYLYFASSRRFPFN